MGGGGSTPAAHEVDRDTQVFAPHDADRKNAAAARKGHARRVFMAQVVRCEAERLGPHPHVQPILI
jgi:hypothetical protein